MPRRTQRKWTKEEVEFLIKNYDKMDNREIARILGRSVISVQHKASRLGLRKSDKIYYYNIGSGLFKILERKIMQNS
ncbi:MAG: hypothetical protein ACXQTW_02995 [Candidatus Methanospirareceae archaeon]